MPTVIKAYYPGYEKIKHVHKKEGPGVFGPIYRWGLFYEPPPHLAESKSRDRSKIYDE